MLVDNMSMDVIFLLQCTYSVEGFMNNNTNNNENPRWLKESEILAWKKFKGGNVLTTSYSRTGNY